VIVIKVGGSLYDHPHLIPGLLLWMNFPTMDGWPYLLVPGGGTAADAVRAWDRVHQLGEDTAHWLALRAMSLTAGMFHRKLASVVVSHPLENPLLIGPPLAVRVLDAFAFCQADDALPHSWDVTSDSIAARAATVARAERLILLKAIDIPPGTDWETATANGWVDPYFPTAVAGASFPIEAVNFRRWLDESFRGE
jgi:aspartokinase-like uncharacterized kinase